MDTVEFEVDRERYTRYWRMCYHILAVLLLPAFGAGLVLWLLYGRFKKSYWRRFLEILSYRLTDNTLVVEKGVYFRRQMNIPLWKITDVVVSQGPLERRYGLRRLHIQTAGQGVQVAEALLMGLVDPEGVRQLILDRMAAVGQRGE